MSNEKDVSKELADVTSKILFRREADSNYDRRVDFLDYAVTANNWLMGE